MVMYMGQVIKKCGCLYKAFTRSGKELGRSHTVEGCKYFIHDYIILCYEKGFEVPERHLEIASELGGYEVYCNGR